MRPRLGVLAPGVDDLEAAAQRVRPPLLADRQIRPRPEACQMDADKRC